MEKFVSELDIVLTALSTEAQRVSIKTMGAVKNPDLDQETKSMHIRESIRVIKAIRDAGERISDELIDLQNILNNSKF